MANEETGSAIEIVTDYDEVINQASIKLRTLADSAEAEYGERILQLATLTAPEIKGIEGTGSQFRVASVRVRQPISSSAGIPEDCKPGQLFSTKGGTLGDSLTFIPILRHAQRKKWTQDSQIDCLSIDGVRGTRYGECKSCPYSQFEQGKTMECSSGHTFFVVTPELDALYRLDFQKSSAKAGKNILNLTEPPALWGKSFTLGTLHETAGGRNYYRMNTKPTGTKTPDTTMAVCELLHEFFHAQYQKALQRVLNPQETTEVPDSGTRVIIADDDSNEVDFQDSM